MREGSVLMVYQLVCKLILILKARTGLNVNTIKTNIERETLPGTWSNVVCRGEEG